LFLRQHEYWLETLRAAHEREGTASPAGEGV